VNPEPAPGPAASLKRPPLRTTVRELLLGRILAGVYGPGDRLVEYRIARELGVSQAPVREALRDLEAMRVVEIRPHLGARVRALPVEELADAAPVRASLEETAAGLAAVRLARHPGDLDRLREHLAEMRDAAADGNPQRLARHSVAFHRQVVVSAGNPVLLDVWNALGVELHTALGVRDAPRSLGESADSHQPILDALVAGDAEAAARLSREHAEAWTGHPVGRTC
jgi:DNA-binding GntR family transcriptional regulator